MMGILELQRKLRQKEISATELAQMYLQRIQNSSLNAFINVQIDATLKQAKIADGLLQNNLNHEKMPLLGIPIAHKDVFVTKIWRSTAGSKMLENYISPFDATVVSRLYASGMICLGKTNMDEFAMGSSNENSAYGAVSNPHAENYVSGGSSGGSAAAVAANLCPAATGSDTGGSIRQPASFCGITGIKPTYGSISRYGMVAYASSLDQAGPMAHTAEDCAILLEAMVAKDEHDSTSIQHPKPNFTQALYQNWRDGSNPHKPLQGLRIGLPKEFLGDTDASVQQKIDAAIAELTKLGAVCVDISLPRTALSIPAYYVIAAAQASSNLARYDGVRYGFRAKDYTDLNDMYKKTRSLGFGAEVKKRIMVGAYVLSQGYYDAYYLKAQKIRRLIALDFQKAFTQCDIIAGPVAPTTAWQKGKYAQNAAHMYLADIFTLGASLAGLPCMSLPCGMVQHHTTNNIELPNLPVGLQLIAPYFSEADILQTAHIYQKNI
jgi:aspartyl-tRNA(Asn)/glutamyl-tRNA(Gln) amidotransferase subunit A